MRERATEASLKRPVRESEVSEQALGTKGVARLIFDSHRWRERATEASSKL